MALVPDTQTAKLDAAIKFVEYSVALKGAKILAVSQYPFLGFPVISQLYDLFMNWQAGYIYRALTKVADFSAVQLKTDQEKAEYKSALLGMAVAHSSGNSDAISKATDNFRVSLGRSIRFDTVQPK